MNTDVEVVKLLSNGDIACSGGPEHFEVIMFRKNPKTLDYEFVDSLNTEGQVVW